MQEDLHSEAALTYLSEVTKQALTVLVSDEETKEFTTMLEYIDNLLGLSLLQVKDVTSAQKQLIADRETARMAANWNESDRLRKVLENQGIGLRDTSYGAIWFPRRQT
jgi:cysteinyl-tRNA synthetase